MNVNVPMRLLPAWVVEIIGDNGETDVCALIDSVVDRCNKNGGLPTGIKAACGDASGQGQGKTKKRKQSDTR